MAQALRSIFGRKKEKKWQELHIYQLRLETCQRSLSAARVLAHATRANVAHLIEVNRIQSEMLLEKEKEMKRLEEEKSKEVTSQVTASYSHGDVLTGEDPEKGEEMEQGKEQERQEKENENEREREMVYCH
ncbi:cilia- and flagella-associated protein 251-like isoform X4 [Branchiostoma floridae]|uniref:Cilia- and flagella-associated protein 251-like isoform X4 n=1 Tax=Branchiostoma floridae TaxID=7739 RepID=A0A9J7LNQ0_BRAFL|nr:cilia- and flagella-associated protein 251-like isoform X4 [Branchiostoma floridae]